MSIHHLRYEQFVPAPIREVWAFFSNPQNLAVITPEYMKFRVTSQNDAAEIYPGQIITYKVSPLLGIPLSWMTEITHVAHQQFFVDEQRVGPYSIWHHEHHFREAAGGTHMTDLLHYTLPLGPLGDIAHSIFVKKQLQGIFDYRRRKVEELFGA